MHLKTKLVALCALGLAVSGVVVAGRGGPTPTFASMAPAPAPELEGAAGGRAVLGRLWFDRLPTSSKEDETLWIFLAGGVGLQIAGSAYRWTTEVFDLERAGNRLELVTLQDDKTIRVEFEVKACDEKPPFNLCLRLSEPLRGNKVLYGFGSEEEAAERFDWVRAARTRGHAAEETATRTP